MAQKIFHAGRKGNDLDLESETLYMISAWPMAADFGARKQSQVCLI